MASDAFFPFRDGIDSAAESGIVAVIQPGGSMRDEEVIAAADEQWDAVSARFDEAEVRLAKGDTVLFYTDGLVEAMNASGDMFGFERLEQFMAAGYNMRAAEIVEQLKQKIK